MLNIALWDGSVKFRRRDRLLLVSLWLMVWEWRQPTGDRWWINTSHLFKIRQISPGSYPSHLRPQIPLIKKNEWSNSLLCSLNYVLQDQHFEFWCNLTLRNQSIWNIRNHILWHSNLDQIISKALQDRVKSRREYLYFDLDIIMNEKSNFSPSMQSE